VTDDERTAQTQGSGGGVTAPVGGPGEEKDASNSCNNAVRCDFTTDTVPNLLQVLAASEARAPRRLLPRMVKDVVGVTRLPMACRLAEQAEQEKQMRLAGERGGVIWICGVLRLTLMTSLPFWLHNKLNGRDEEQHKAQSHRAKSLGLYHRTTLAATDRA
jgi:hypothetical protein